MDGIVAVTVTPLKTGYSPDFEEAARQTEILCAENIDAIFPCSSTGEFTRLETEDKLQILRTVAQSTAGRKTLIAGACDASADGVIRYIESSKQLGYDACVVCPPYYYGLSQEAVLAFYRQICSAAGGMPVIAYHVPFFTTGIEIETLRHMLTIPNLTGLKDSSANMKRISHIVDIAASERPDFCVYTGTDDCLLPALTAGCRGSMTALGASMPRTIVSIYNAFSRDDMSEAMKIQRSILPILREADSLPFPLGYRLLAMVTGLRSEVPADDFTGDKWERVYANLLELLRQRGNK